MVQKSDNEILTKMKTAKQIREELEMAKEKENELIEQITKIGLYLAEVQAENRILKDINDKLMQALRIYNVSGPTSAVNGGGELLAGALAKTVCGGFKDCTDVKGIMCKCEGVCELKDEPRIAPL